MEDEAEEGIMCYNGLGFVRDWCSFERIDLGTNLHDQDNTVVKQPQSVQDLVNEET